MVTYISGSDRSHYYDAKHDREIVKIKPGEFFATTHKFIIATVLGSCVAACIRDATRGSAGMNHFMLPEHSAAEDASSLLYGLFAMESLINEFIRHGSQRRDLEAKIFGGATVVDVISREIGAQNAAFAVDYLKREGIRTTVMDLGGVAARRVLFYVEDGRVLVKYLWRRANDTIERREAEYAREIALSLPPAVELF